MSQTILKPDYLDKNLSKILDLAIDLAIKEDLGLEENMDITTEATVPANCMAKASILLKQKAVVAGSQVAILVFERFSNDIKAIELIKEGTYIDEVPTTIIELSGPARAILTAERLALNLMQRMSGVATLTRAFVDRVKDTGIEILDTRKTTPCLRAFDRIAVHLGGGTNHRSGLYDQVLIKDNHIAIAGSISKAIDYARQKFPDKSLEIETRTLDEVIEAVSKKPDTILLDNMLPDMVRSAIETISGQARIEISGGITLDTIDSYLINGVDAISIGALTHSPRAVDISLEMIPSL